MLKDPELAASVDARLSKVRLPQALAGKGKELSPRPDHHKLQRSRSA
jgi:hypothetical protein